VLPPLTIIVRKVGKLMKVYKMQFDLSKLKTMSVRIFNLWPPLCLLVILDWKSLVYGLIQKYLTSLKNLA
jgi:hypothetical protein